MTQSQKEIDELFRTTPHDVDVDDDINDMLCRFESKHLTDTERNIINEALKH